MLPLNCCCRLLSLLILTCCAEGICVTIPVYFATGKKWKGIMWAAIAGITEPIGALLGYAVLQSGHMDDVAMGVIMGLVSCHHACTRARLHVG
jgi:zinc transporter ZupT